MTRSPHARFWASLTIAFLLQLVALPEAIAAARPLWIPLVLGYWALEEPRVPTLLAAFLSGLMLDVLYNTVLGQHAAGLLLLVYSVIRLRSVFVLFPLWQSTVALAPAWAGYCLLMMLIDNLALHRADPLLRWLPAVSSTLFWPLVHTVLDGHSRRSRSD
ncbi:rod shape-determining protein MreD [Panacagrimonas sp.]|uniref:rod shape-determining protein MreD n=1 Tax=Panacagrimonas sp. TaxID=2480088 RepID=UPI003B517A7E